MRLKFVGAAQTVTGSMHLVEAGGTRILLDCGLFQGRRAESIKTNKTFDFFDPAAIDAVVLSHAHIDHSGNLPNLVKQGFTGPIYSTPATRDLAGIMLADSGKIQEQDTEFLNKKLARRGEPPVQPLYDTEDALAVLPSFVTVSYHRETHIADGVRLTFLDAGHILGSAMVVLRIKENGKEIVVLFTGDLGRSGTPILKNPDPVAEADVLISESTYGGRRHDPIRNIQDGLRDAILRTIKRSGRVIIPAFSVERTQELTYTLHRLFDSKAIPKIPVFVDSPLAVNATEVFRLHPECFNKDTFKMVLAHDDPFGFEYIKYIRLVEDSKKLNDMKEPMIIISASGMAEGGRILHHLRNNIENPRNLVLLVGYAAQYTLARRLMDGDKEVRIFGETHKVKCRVAHMDDFSGHADRRELLDYVKTQSPEKLKHIFLVHGEAEQALPLKDAIRSMGFPSVHFPKMGDSFEV